MNLFQPLAMRLRFYYLVEAVWWLNCPVYKQVTKLCGNHQQKEAAEVGRRQGWKVRNRQYRETKTTKTFLEKLDKSATCKLIWKNQRRMRYIHRFLRQSLHTPDCIWGRKCCQCHQDSCCCGTWSMIWLECQMTPNSPIQIPGSLCSWSCCCCDHQGPLKPSTRRATEKETSSPFMFLLTWSTEVDNVTVSVWNRPKINVTLCHKLVEGWDNLVICSGWSFISPENLNRVAAWLEKSFFSKWVGETENWT